MLIGASNHFSTPVLMAAVVWPGQYQKYYTKHTKVEALKVTGKVTESLEAGTLEAQIIDCVKFWELS
jgi:hypothetical protein